ncbi:MAG: hypothetical protein Q9218_000970, partial [Villophora microphyllina]
MVEKDLGGAPVVGKFHNGGIVDNQQSEPWKQPVNVALPVRSQQAVPPITATQGVPRELLSLSIPYLGDADILASQTEEGQRYASVAHWKLAIDSDTKESSSKRAENGVLRFDELVDRLLLQDKSDTNVKFTAIFLCLYRVFAKPLALLTAVESRFEDISKSKYLHTTRITAQLRCLSVLAIWLSEYPGDFAHSVTRTRLIDFASALEGQRSFSVVVKDIKLCIHAISVNDDTIWACLDVPSSEESTREDHPVRSSLENSTPSLELYPSTEAAANGVEKSKNPSRPATPSTPSRVGISSGRSAGSFHARLSSTDGARRQALHPMPVSARILNKAYWRLFMRLSNEDLAQELTRIDWGMFSLIRPRDIIRHVQLPAEEKKKYRGLENVSRLICQFNHVALWVANIVLLREKAKHRAKALEKFIDLAWRLRQLNNYNSLGAVVAGINGTAVHRLNQTRALVSHRLQKQFMCLEVLMGTQKSHFAYRLAWSNTSTERIPFLPLHCRDLVFAEQGNLTFSDETRCRINWKKFEIIGNVIMSIRSSQAIPYPCATQNDEAQNLIMGSNFTKDED